MIDHRDAVRGDTTLADEDTTAREQALDVSQSFLVQAPAGSGKTELLIQRFLALLAKVDRPERIVAVTFTRKAAGEMRERVIAALRDAQDKKPALTAHAQQTRVLADAALMQDERQGWQLASHPARLQVQTIDALSASIARQAPLATHLGAAPRCEEQADWLYREAARDALFSATPADPSWRRLLAHVDNDADTAITLLSTMLQKRDQWLGKLNGGDPASLRRALERVLAIEIAGELEVLRASFPAALTARLVRLERYAAANLAADSLSPDIVHALEMAAAKDGLPPVTLEHLDAWRSFSAWLLVKDGAVFRRKCNRLSGFPAVATGAGTAQRQAFNTAMAEVLRDLASIQGLAQALHDGRGLPPPTYADETWAIVQALLAVLPQVAAHLSLTFRANGTVDFIEGALAALDALGPPEAPTDLLLRLDYAVHHLLLDEFQDTSYTQLELISRLTAGWQPGDGHTVFAVGDPMQSIYRFREAEVRLFIEAQQQKRIADVAVECLVLRRNFRSRHALVAWTNAVFPNVLGVRNDLWRSVVAFAKAVAVDRTAGLAPPAVEIFCDDAQEASAAMAHVRSALARGADCIAILARTRLHLERILPALRRATIAFEAVDLDFLGQRQAIRDLTSLTHALVQPADRLAWLAVLRAPWCGIALADLLAIVAAADRHPSRSIAALVSSQEPGDELSADGGLRFARLAATLAPVLAQRGRAALSSRVRGAWLALGGPACVDEPIDLSAAESFFELLARYECAGDIAQWQTFVAALAALRAQPDGEAASRVQVMTLHRAKGLEFDTVIIPGLARPRTRDTSDLLRWRRREQGLLLAPMNARGGDEDPLYRYLRRLGEDEEDAELGRLLYVGCTRAKKRLHLLGVLEPERDPNGLWSWKDPSPETALARLWPSVRGTVTPPVADAAQRRTVSKDPVMLSRVPLAWSAAPSRADIPLAKQTENIERRDIIVFDWAREIARHVGTVTHRLLAQLASDGLDAWTPGRIDNERARIVNELRAEGVEDAALNDAAAEVSTLLRKLVGDARGRWLFAQSHIDSRSEWALAGLDVDAIVHIVIDRTFVADGVRWIIDFKTGRHEGADLDAFLDSERVRYADQLERYARIVRGLDPRPIRLGLYYPMQCGWREWAFVA